MWCVRNGAPNVFKIFFLFSVHRQTWTNFFFWFVRDVYYTNYSLQFWWQWWLFTSLLRGLVKSIFPPPFRRIIVYYLDGYWIWWSIKINRFYSWARNFHSERKKILLLSSTYTKLNFCSSDIPVIPDLEDVQEEDMMTQIAAPPRWDVTLPTGDGGGGGINRYSCDPRLGVCTRRGHNDTYCGPTQVGCCFTHGGGGGVCRNFQRVVLH